MSEITELLHRCRGGDSESLGAVFSRLYPELKRIASAKLAGLPAGATLTPTVLVHEAYLRLIGNETLDLEGRRHFYATAAKAMRHYLIDCARRASAVKRGGGEQRVTWTEGFAGEAAGDLGMLDLDRALDELEEINPPGREVVELRFFAGLTAQETAELMDISLRTVQRQWERARAFLHVRIEPRVAQSAVRPDRP